MALESAEEKKPGYSYYQMIAITFAALAIESLGNSFGKQFIERWDDFETASPIAKLRIVCQHLNIKINFNKKPWSTVLWLITFRNKIAHARSEMINFDEEMTDNKFDKIRYDFPLSKFEKELSLPNAKRAVSSIKIIKEMLLKRLSEEDKDIGNFELDGYQGSASLIQGSD